MVRRNGSHPQASGHKGRKPGKRIIKNIKPGAHERHVLEQNAHLEKKLAAERKEMEAYEGVTSRPPEAGDPVLVPCPRTGGYADVGKWLSTDEDPPLAMPRMAGRARRVGSSSITSQVPSSSGRVAEFRRVKEIDLSIVRRVMGPVRTPKEKSAFDAVFGAVRGDTDYVFYRSSARSALSDSGVKDPKTSDTLSDVMAKAFCKSDKLEVRKYNSSD